MRVVLCCPPLLLSLVLLATNCKNFSFRSPFLSPFPPRCFSFRLTASQLYLVCVFFFLFLNLFYCLWVLFFCAASFKRSCLLAFVALLPFSQRQRINCRTTWNYKHNTNNATDIFILTCAFLWLPEVLFNVTPNYLHSMSSLANCCTSLINSPELRLPPVCHPPL